MQRIASLVLIGLGGLSASCTEPAARSEPVGAGAEAGAPGTVMTGVGCPEPTSGPTTHETSDLYDAETWTADASPHILPSGMVVRALLTLEPCAEVLIAPEQQIVLRDEGSIEGIGTADQPIHIGKSESEPWANLATGGLVIRLAYTTIDGGGYPANIGPTGAAMIKAMGLDGALPTQEVLDFDHVTVEGSVSQGIIVSDGAGFSQASDALIVSANAGFPVKMWARAAGTLPPGEYTGNDRDAVNLISGAGNSAVKEDTTLFDRGVPYVIGNEDDGPELRIQADDPPLLTIEPGVTLRFIQDGGLYVDFGAGTTTSGALAAVGTEAKPIVFTSDRPNPAAGDWRGIYFSNMPDPRSIIDHAKVEYAGGESTSAGSSCFEVGSPNPDAAIRFFGGGADPAYPTTQIVTNTIIDSSAGHGIDRGWRGDATDFLPTNTFVSIARCWQTYPTPESGTCPDPVPCPTE